MSANLVMYVTKLTWIYICDLMGQNQSHVAIFSYGVMELYQFLGHIQCFKLVKTRSQDHDCLCRKLLNFEIDETENLKI